MIGHAIAVNPLSLDFVGDKPFYVYLYRDPRPRKKLVPIYVGKGTAANIRAEVHWRRISLTRQHNPLFAAVLQKIFVLGLTPAIEVVQGFDDEEDAFTLEITLIARFGRRDLGRGSLCNLTDGGEGMAGHRVSSETRAKLSAAKLGKPGQTPTLEARAKMSAAAKGKPKSPEHSAKVGAARRGKPGKPHTAETRAKMSAAKLGKSKSPEHCANMSVAQRGKPRSDKQRAAFAKMMAARPPTRSVDARAKTSATLRDAWAARRAAGVGWRRQKTEQ